MRSFNLIGHRGASAEAPENTLASFKKALTLGVDGFEFDVQLSSDGIPIVMHDKTLSRTTNEKSSHAISEISLAKLKKLDAGSWFSKDYRDEPIPTLDEVLTLQRGTAGLIIELKTFKKPSKAFPETVLKVLKKYRKNSKGPITLGSFSPSILQYLQELGSPYLLQGIAENRQTITKHLDLGIKCLSISDELVSPALIKEFHRSGISVYVWTVDDPNRAQFLIELGVDGIITNDPGKISQIVTNFE